MSPPRLASWLLLLLCLSALSCGGTRVSDDQLIKDLDSPHWQIRASAADELGRRRVDRAAARLGAALTDSSDEVRGSAAMALGLIGAKSELDKVRQLIDKEEDRQVKVLALYTLAELAAGETGDRLRDDVVRVEGKLDDDSRRVKRAAARVLRILRGPDKPEPEEKRRGPRRTPSPDDPGQRDWSFDRIEDHLALARDGECTLTRTFVVRGLRSNPTKRLGIFLPPAFPQVESVVDGNGTHVAFDFRRKGDLRQIWFNVPPLGKGDTASYTFAARSRRLVFASSANELLFAYSPAPADTSVAALSVELSLPEGARAIEPSDLALGSTTAGQVATFQRTDLTRTKLDAVMLRVGIPAAVLQLPRTPPRYFTRGFDLALAAAVAAVALGVLAACIVWLRRRLGAASHRAILVAVLTTGAFLFLTPILIEDNLSYYASVRSAVIDGDLDRVNEYAEMNQSQAYDPDHRGPLDPMFASLSRAPFVAAAHGLTRAMNAITPRHAANGFSFPYLFIVAVGDFLAVLFGCLACFSLVERRAGRPYALFAVLAIFAGTNLDLFAYAWTAGSFQASFFLFAVFLNLWDKTRDHRSGEVWLVSGALLGLMGLTRTLNLGFVVLPLLDWLRTATALYKEDGLQGVKRHVGDGVLFAAGLFLAFAPQLAMQRLVDDTWFVDSYGVGTGRFSGMWAHLSGLFLQRATDRTDGLFATMPMLVFAFAGLATLFRSDRWMGTLLTVTLGLQLFAIASYEIYWGYFWYGTPYLMPSSPILCLALASFMKFVHTRWPRRGLAVMACVAVPLVLRTAWCTLQQLGLNLTGEPTSDGSTLEVLHAMLIPGRKLDVDLLLNSSEFGCLLRETVGALRARDFGQLLAAMFWVAVLVAVTLIAYWLTRRIGGWFSGLTPRARNRFAIPALALVWIACVGWALSVAAATDVDYRYLFETRSSPQREIKVHRLDPGETYTLPVEFEFPGTMSVVTLLEGAERVPQGARVGTIEIEGAGKKMTVDLRAGIDTADFAIDRPESKGERGHTAPLDKACMAWRVGDDSSHLYTARAYRTAVDLPAVGNDFEISVTSTLERGALSVAIINVMEQKLPPDPSRRRWLAERW